MYIRPQDLSPQWHVRITHRRCRTSRAETPIPEPHLGLFGRIWAWRSGLAAARRPAAVSAAGPTLRVASACAFWLTGLGLGPLLAFVAHWTQQPPLWPLLAVAPPLAAAVMGNLVFRFVNGRPLYPAELETWLQEVSDPAQREFLLLLADVTRANLPVALHRSIRTSVAALGEALESLPEPGGGDARAGDLLTEASRLDASAARESDPVVRESHRRRAQAMREQHRLQEHSTTRLRREQAVRAELQTQIAGLRTALAALHETSASGPALEAVAMGAQQAALTAVAYANARYEVEDGVSEPTASRLPPSDEVQVAHLRVGTDR